jgi:hypothetical protein
MISRDDITFITDLSFDLDFPHSFLELPRKKDFVCGNSYNLNLKDNKHILTGEFWFKVVSVSHTLKDNKPHVVIELEQY